MSQAMLTKNHQRQADDAAFELLCTQLGTDAAIIRRKHGNAAVCAARRAITTALRERDWTYARIARAMRRDEWSIAWLVRTGQTKGGAK